ncbi:MAG: hypothetical protein PUC33_08715 [Oscillospiraceae bacterium]|nr:hypothetical protein [Oscillospiraceae bacterium]
MEANYITNHLFDKLGVEMRIEKEETVCRFCAFLQPLRYKNKIYLSGVPTELGYDGMNKYLLMCDPRVDFSEIDGITCRLILGENAYGVDHCETIYGGKKPRYIWAIVHREG